MRAPRWGTVCSCVLDLDTIPDKERSKFRRMKDMVAIVPRISREEMDLQAEFDRRLSAGEDPTEIIEKLRGCNHGG